MQKHLEISWMSELFGYQRVSPNRGRPMIFLVMRDPQIRKSPILDGISPTISGEQVMVVDEQLDLPLLAIINHYYPYY